MPKYYDYVPNNVWSCMCRQNISFSVRHGLYNGWNLAYQAYWFNISHNSSIGLRSAAFGSQGIKVRGFVHVPETTSTCLVQCNRVHFPAKRFHFCHVKVDLQQCTFHMNVRTQCFQAEDYTHHLTASTILLFSP